MRKDGTTFYSEVQGTSINFDKQPHMLGVIRDVTEKKQREDELKLKDIVFQSSVAANSTSDLNGNITSVNQSFLNVWGYKSKQEVLGKPIPQFIKYEEEALKILQGLTNEEKWQGNYTALKKDGSTFIAQANASVLLNADGEKIGYQSSVFDVTQQKEAERAIIQEKEFSESIINALPGIFYLFNDQGKYIKWNKMLEELSGFTPEEITERSPLDYFADYHKEKVADAIQNAFKEGEASVETDLMVKGKIPTPFYFTGRSIVLQGKPHLLGVGMDISQRKEAEKEKEKALQDLNERIKEITCIFNINEAIKNPNVDIPEVLKKVTQIIPEGWHYPEKTSVELLLDGKKYGATKQTDTEDFLLENIVVDNETRGYVKVMVSDLSEEEALQAFMPEEVDLLKTIADNISIYIDRVESEKEIKESEENFRNVYANSPVSIWQEDWTGIIERIDALKKEGVNDFKKYFNENRQFVDEALTKVVINDVNQATLEMFEADSKDDLVKSLEVVFATEDTLPGFIGELIALAEGKQVYETEMKLNTAKGNLINTMLRMSFPSEEVQDGQVLVSIMDITALKIMQQRLNDSMEKLKRSNKELERFAYVASHDLQEPLRMVSSYTQLLERRYKGQMDERADKYIHYAVDGANRMQNLINDLLDFSRVSTRGEKFTKTDTSEVVKSTLNNLETRINETGAQVKTGKLPVIKADSGQIERLFLNLIGNALKFSKPDEKPVIEINAKSQKDKWLFSVKDNGIGIDEKFKEKVFVVFQRLHGATQYKGTGIGLAICKRIVQRHEGEIWFESEENKGATFFFTLKKHKLDNNKNE
jgi:PAS domain S-box-containing protein